MDEFYRACISGNISKIEKIIKLVNYSIELDFNLGLVYACSGGHLQIVERMIELGAYDFNWGLYNACIGGHLQIVERMIELGANNFNRGLARACSGGHLQIVERMIELGGKFEYESNRIKYKKLLKIRKILNKLFISDLVYEIYLVL